LHTRATKLREKIAGVTLVLVTIAKAVAYVEENLTAVISDD